MTNITNKTLQNGFSLPVIGLGVWPMGGYRKRNPQNDDTRDIRAIQHAFESGVTHFDAAEIYAAGYAETLLGKAIKDFDRSKLHITSKAGRDSLQSTEAVKQACRRSLDRVGLDYFDVYYLHLRMPEYSLEAQMRAMEELYEEGLIKNIAVSNFTTKSLQEAQSLCKYPIVANQVHYNLIFRGPERDGLVKYCQDNDVMIVAYRPTELGKLANTGNPVMLDLSDRYEGKTHAQLAINWLISQKNIVAIFGGSRIEFIDENIGAADFTMSDADVEYAREKYGGQIDVSDSVPLR